jgi:hypothetical protein
MGKMWENGDEPMNFGGIHRNKPSFPYYSNMANISPSPTFWVPKNCVTPGILWASMVGMVEIKIVRFKCHRMSSSKTKACNILCWFQIWTIHIFRAQVPKCPLKLSSNPMKPHVLIKPELHLMFLGFKYGL